MKPKLLTILTVLISINCFCETTNVVFREPFTLTLPIDKERYYEQKYPKIPYVADNCVYIFPGEEFRVGLHFTDTGIDLSCDQKKESTVYFEFKFWNELTKGENTVNSFLTGKNQTSKKITYDAVMVVHDSKKPLKTSIIPTGAGMTNFEHWPHPIMQLMLHNFRVVDDADAPLKKSYPQKVYVAIFRIKVDQKGELLDFGLSKVIDPQSGSTNAVDVVLPKEYIESAKSHVIARGYDPYIVDGKPIEFYDNFFYDPEYPDEVISEIKK